jgi:putative DNA primase/helicase
MSIATTRACFRTARSSPDAIPMTARRSGISARRASNRVRRSWPRSARPSSSAVCAADTIVRALGLRRAGREFTGRCPSCGYRSGFTVTGRDRTVLLHCHAGGCSQSELWDALEQAGLATCNSRRGSVERSQTAARHRRAPQAGGRSTPADKPPAMAENRATALAIWRRSRPADGSIIETYLREVRGCTGPIPPTLRFAFGKHPSDPERWHSMMVAAVRHDGRLVAVHRTFLRQDGSGKANLDPDKMTLGRCKGAAVPLAPAGPLLAVAEGIETALSFMEATTVPTWAALSAGGIRNLVLPAIVREVIIAADPDPVGLIAARAAARRWLAEGRSIRIARPPLNSDFNDLLRAAS